MKLSPTMEACLEYIRDEGGGAIERYQGGFWASPGGSHPQASHRLHYGTNTVQALVSRGRLQYTEWKENRTGCFPVRAEIVKEPKS